MGFRNLKLWSRGWTELFVPDAADALDVPRPRFLSVGRVAVEKNLEAFLGLNLPGSKIVTGDGQPSAPSGTPTPTRSSRGQKGKGAGRHLRVLRRVRLPEPDGHLRGRHARGRRLRPPITAFPVQGPLDVVRNGVTAFWTATSKGLHGGPHNRPGRAGARTLLLLGGLYRAVSGQPGLKDATAVPCTRRSGRTSDGGKTARPPALATVNPRCPFNCPRGGQAPSRT